MNENQSHDAPDEKSDPTPSGVLLALACLGAAQALWAAFQWRELGELRRGGETLCDLVGGGCGAAWDSPVATAIHESTGLPIAAWGVVWGVAATAVALFRLGRPRAVFTGAVRLLGLAGVVGCGLLAFVLIQSQAFCMTCLVTYGLVLGYAAIAWWVPLGDADFARGGALSAAACLLVFGLALVAGRNTPTVTVSSQVPEVAGADSLDERLRSLLGQLPAEAREALARELGNFRDQTPVNPPVARALVGNADAVVRVTDFHDTLCPHCARLHEVLEQLHGSLAPGQLAIDPHHFPLDATCNAALSSEGKNSVRCDASRALICLEGHPEGFAFSSAVFRNQDRLNREKLFELAEPYLARTELEACLASDRTAEALASDVAWAEKNGIRGTPFVFINGKQVPGFAPLVYALVLAGGNPDHPAFASLGEH